MCAGIHTRSSVLKGRFGNGQLCSLQWAHSWPIGEGVGGAKIQSKKTKNFFD